MVNVAVFCSGFALVYYLKTENCKNTATPKKVNFRPVLYYNYKMYIKIIFMFPVLFSIVHDQNLGCLRWFQFLSEDEEIIISWDEFQTSYHIITFQTSKYARCKIWGSRIIFLAVTKNGTKCSKEILALIDLY